MTDPHGALYEGLKQQHPAALDELIAALSGQVMYLAGMILGQLGRPEDAEEVASDVFAGAWTRIAEFNPERSTLTGWVLMLTKYAALDRRRQLMRERYTAEREARVIPLMAAPEPVTEVSPEDELLRLDRQERLHESINRLEPEDRELIFRRYFLEESVADLMRETGLSRGALDNRLWRARQALKALLSEKGEVQNRGKSAL